MDAKVRQKTLRMLSNGVYVYPLCRAVVIALSYLARSRVGMRPLQIRPLPAHGK